MSKVPVFACAYAHTSDINVDRKFDANEWERLLNMCVTQSRQALETPLSGYEDFHRNHMSEIFSSMRGTHRSIRRLLADATPYTPEGVDTLSLARIQLEGLYTICLMLEDSQYVDTYLKDHWGKVYVTFLLNREETKALPRWNEYATKSPFWLAQLRDYCGVTPEQQLTIEHTELGTLLPAGFVMAPIPHFPTPGATIKKISSNSAKRKMLERLYPRYVELCSFTHGLQQANFFRGMFDKRSFHRTLMTDGKTAERFQRTVVAEAFMMSFLSIAQASAELMVLYPTNVDLASAAMNAWNPLSDAHLLARAIWNIRTSKLLGVIAS